MASIVNFGIILFSVPWHCPAQVCDLEAVVRLSHKDVLQAQVPVHEPGCMPSMNIKNSWWEKRQLSW